MDIRRIDSADMEIGRMKASMSNAASRILSAALALAVVFMAARADAAMVSGVYTNRSGTPLADHQLHFENKISGDMYLTRTDTDGSFSSELPPGSYDLRAERGVVLKSGIRVDAGDLNLGRVPQDSSFDLRRPFQREGVGPSLVDSGAPATAHLATKQEPNPPTSAAQSNASTTGPAGAGPTPTAPVR
jgi:hypothetical protein